MKQFLANIDILVDGPYIQGLDNNEKWRGSSNQDILFLSDRYKNFEWVKGEIGREQEYHVREDGKYLKIGIPRSKSKQRGGPQKLDSGLGVKPGLN